MAAPITQIRNAQDQGNRTAEEPQLTIYQRLLSIAKELPSIAKTGQNREQNYPYIEASAIAATMQGLFAKHGVFLKSELTEAEFSDFTTQKGSKGEKVKVFFDFSFINCFDKDDLISFKPWPGVAMDYSDKALNKAMTAAQKTFLMKQFLISDVDPDADSPQAEAAANNQQHPPKQPAVRPVTPQSAQPARPAQAAPQAKPAQTQQQSTQQPSQTPGDTQAISKLNDLTQDEFGYWLRELKIGSKELAETLTNGKEKTLKGWSQAYKAANPDAAIKNWYRFALHEYVQGLMKHKPQAGWLWDEKTQLPRQLEDVPFEEDLPDDGLPEE